MSATRQYCNAGNEESRERWKRNLIFVLEYERYGAPNQIFKSERLLGFHSAKRGKEMYFILYF